MDPRQIIQTVPTTDTEDSESHTEEGHDDTLDAGSSPKEARLLEATRQDLVRSIHRLERKVPFDSPCQQAQVSRRLHDVQQQLQSCVEQSLRAHTAAAPRAPPKESWQADAVEEYLGPLLAHGFEFISSKDAHGLWTSGDELPPFQFHTNGRPVFVVNVSFLVDSSSTCTTTTVSEAPPWPLPSSSSSLHGPLQPQQLHARSTPRKKRSSIYRWWTNLEVTRQLEAALERKLANDAVISMQDCHYWIVPFSASLSSSLSKEEEEEDETNLLWCWYDHQWSPWCPPEPPEHVTATVTTTELELEWSMADTSKKNSVAVSLFSCQSSSLLRTVTSQFSSCSWTHLEPRTEYRVELRGISRIQGVSTRAVTKLFQTPKALSWARRIYQSIHTSQQQQAHSAKNDIATVFVEPAVALDPHPTESHLPLEASPVVLQLACRVHHVVQSQAFHLPGQPMVDSIRIVDVAPGLEPHYELGPMEQAWVCLLTGEMGAGKSTHLNAMVNWLFGVEWDDPFRLLLVDDSEQRTESGITPQSTVYRIRHLPGMPVDQSLILIDSPGFAATPPSLQTDLFTRESFRQLFSLLTHVNCVGWVLPANRNRLTTSFQYVIQKVLELLDTTLQDNLLPICTFADAGIPSCLAALEEDTVPFRHYVKVQNGPFSCRHMMRRRHVGQEVDGNTNPLHETRSSHQEKLHWEIAYNGIASMFRIVDHHMVLRPLDKSLAVLEIRRGLHQQLQSVVQELWTITNQVVSIVQDLDRLLQTLGQSPTEPILHNQGNELEPPPEQGIQQWSTNKQCLEATIANKLSDLDERQGRLVTLLSDCVKVQQSLEGKGLRNNPRAAANQLDSLIRGMLDQTENNMQKDFMLHGLYMAKREFDCKLDKEHNSNRQRDMRRSKQAALVCIRQEWTRRSQLGQEERLREDTEPSDFYNQVLSLLPNECHSPLLLPAPLGRTHLVRAEPETGYEERNFPPYRESLIKTAQALRQLVSRWDMPLVDGNSHPTNQ